MEWTRAGGNKVWTFKNSYTSLWASPSCTQRSSSTHHITVSPLNWYITLYWGDRLSLPSTSTLQKTKMWVSHSVLLHSSLVERCMCDEVRNSALICWAMPSLSDSAHWHCPHQILRVCAYICPGQINKVCFCMHRPHIPAETDNKVSTFGSDCALCSPAGVPVRSLQISFRAWCLGLFNEPMWLSTSWSLKSRARRKGTREDLSNQEHAN